MANGVTCNRCHTDGLGWAVSRSSGKHYLAWLVPTQIVRDGQIVIEDRIQANLLHRCGPNWDKSHKSPQTVEDARKESAEYAAERARIRALGQSPQPIAQAVPTAATVPAKPARKVRAAAKSGTAVAAVRQAESALPFATANGPVALATADVPGPVEAAVVMTNALVAKGYPREIAAAIVAAGTPAQIAGLLLK